MLHFRFSSLSIRHMQASSCLHCLSSRTHYITTKLMLRVILVSRFSGYLSIPRLNPYASTGQNYHRSDANSLDHQQQVERMYLRHVLPRIDPKHLHRYKQHVDDGVCSCKNIGRWDLDISTRKGYLS